MSHTSSFLHVGEQTFSFDSSHQERDHIVFENDETSEILRKTSHKWKVNVESCLKEHKC